jgi:hypothetical protein
MIVTKVPQKGYPIGFSKVILVLETRGSDHIQEIKKGFKGKGPVNDGGIRRFDVAICDLEPVTSCDRFYACALRDLKRF